MRGPERFGLGPRFERRAVLPYSVGRIKRVILRFRAFDQVELDEARDLVEMAVTRQLDVLSGVVIIEAHALIDARMQASLKGLEDGVVFAEGHRLDDAASKALVPPKQLGRMPSVEKAKRLLKGLEGR
jgi:hypothetical protein